MKLKLFFLLILVCVCSSSSVKGQTIDRKKMKQWSELVDPESLRGAKWKARRIADGKVLKGDSLLMLTTSLPSKGRLANESFGLIRNWVRRTAHDNGFSSMSFNDSTHTIRLVCIQKNIAKHKIVNNRYDITIAPEVVFVCRNLSVDVILNTSAVFILKTHDARSGSGVGPFYRKTMVWKIADMYPFILKSKLPRITSSKAINASFYLLQELTQLSGQVLGVRKTRPKEYSLY